MRRYVIQRVRKRIGKKACENHSAKETGFEKAKVRNPKPERKNRPNLGDFFVVTFFIIFLGLRPIILPVRQAHHLAVKFLGVIRTDVTQHQILMRLTPMLRTK